MKRLLVIADTDNWAFANRASALRDHAPSDWHVEVVFYENSPVESLAFERFDCVFSIPTNLAPKLGFIWDRLGLDIPLVISHNSGLGRRRGHLTQSMLIADAVVINNHATWSNMVSMVHRDKANIYNISNGVCCSTFRPTVPISERPHRVLWIASKPKTDGPEGDIKRYFSILEPLAKLLSNVGDGWSTDFRVVEPGTGMSPAEMAGWYNSGSYVVCSSTSEGTPNIILEGAACGCVPVSLPVGNIPEFIRNGENGVVVRKPNVGAFWDSLQLARKSRDSMSRIAFRTMRTQWDWPVRAGHFFRLFDSLLDGKRQRPWTWMESWQQMDASN